MPSIRWTKEFNGTGRIVLVDQGLILFQLGPDDRWRHEGQVSYLDGEEGKADVHCFAIGGRRLWIREDSRLLAILSGDHVLITECDGALIVLDADGHIVNQRKFSAPITGAAVDGDSLVLSDEHHLYLVDFNLTLRHEILWSGNGSCYPGQWIGGAVYWVEGYQLMSSSKDGLSEVCCPSFRDALLHAAKCFEPQTQIDKDLASLMEFRVFTRGLPPETLWNLSNDSARGLLFLTSPSGPHFAVCIDYKERQVRWCRVLSPGCCGGQLYCLPDGRYVTSTPCGGLLTWLDAEGNVVSRAELNPGEQAYGCTPHLLANGQCMITGGPGLIGYGSDMKRIWTLDKSFFVLAVHPTKTMAAGIDFPRGTSEKQ